MQGQEIFITRKPNSELLGRYIAYYYFHADSGKDGVKEFEYYPNTINAITVYHKSVLEFGKLYSIARPVEEDVYSYCYGGIQKKCRMAAIQTPFSKIAIAFYPLGLNHFVHDSLASITPAGDDLTFEYFRKDLDPVLAIVFQTEDIQTKVNILDDYFLAKLHDFKEEVLIKAVDAIMELPDKLSVNDLANELVINEKTLRRKFLIHLNCTPKQFIDLVQFRRVFNHHLNHKKTAKLTELAMSFGYYDQAAFIHQFKKMTSSNPRRLFQSLVQMGQEELFWNRK